jgi:nucleotide-binding universal stress UspA family protein
MMMFKSFIRSGGKVKILVRYKGSDACKKALALAKQHAAVWQGRIEVVQAITRKEALSYDRIEKAEQQLAQQIKHLLDVRWDSFETTVLVSTQNPGEQIVNFAQAIDADEIVIGSKKRSRIGKFILGSTTQFVVLNAPCPVVVVK